MSILELDFRFCKLVFCYIFWLCW